MKSKREQIMKLCEFDTSKAHKHICKLAKDVGSSWLMSIPPQPYDSDMLLQEPLDHIDKKILPIITALLDRVEQLEGALESVSKTRHKYCWRDNCTCVFDFADIALATSPLDELIQGEK